MFTGPRSAQYIFTVSPCDAGCVESTATLFDACTMVATPLLSKIPGFKPIVTVNAAVGPVGVFTINGADDCPCNCHGT